MNVALVAISGLHTYKREGFGSEYQTVAIVQRNEAVLALPSLALLTLAGMQPGRHHYAYHEIDDVVEVDAMLKDVDLVCISSYTARIHLAYALARRCRELGVPTVIGGPHVSCLPDEAAQHCTAVVIGEGESVWHQVLEDAEAGRLQPVYGSLNATFNLADAPMPAFELLDDHRFRRVTVETSRGCPHRCEFCASSVLISSGYKQKPADKVLAELDKVCRRWRRPFVEFADDNTFVNRRYWREILPELGKRGIRWFAEADASLARDEDLLELMYENGCWQVLLGLESPSISQLDGVEMRNNWKRNQSMPPDEAVRIIQSHGIMVNACFVLGLDSQGPDIFDAIYRFVQETDSFDVQITFLTPFPGTPLYSRLLNEGRLLKEAAWDLCTLFDLNFQPQNMTVEELQGGYMGLAARVFDDSFTKNRRNRIKDRLRSLNRRSWIFFPGAV